MRRKVLFILMVIGAGMAALGELARAERWAANWNATNNTGQTVNNYEVTVEGSQLDAVFGPYANGWPVDPSTGELFPEDRVWTNPYVSPPREEGGSTFIDVEWKTLAPGQVGVPPNQTLHFGVQIQGGQTNPGWQILQPHWTISDSNGNVVKSFPTQTTGFTVTQTASVLYTIYNDTLVPLDIHNLQFMVSPVWIPLAQMVPGYKPLSLYGFGPMQATFTLLPGQSQSFHVPMGITGECFLAKGFSQDPAGDISEWVHQAEIPPIISSGVTVRGWIAPDDYSGDLQDLAVRIELRQAGVIVRIERRLPDATGLFTVANVPPGTYDIAVKTYAHLQRVLSGVPVTTDPTDLLIIPLLSGDNDNDNSVTSTDLSIVLKNMDLTGDP
jgi:hypothetical protein